MKDPTDAEVLAFYDENKTRMPGPFKEFKQQIVDYIKAQRQEAAAKTFADKLRAQADVRILVEKATAPARERRVGFILAQNSSSQRKVLLDTVLEYV